MSTSNTESSHRAAWIAAVVSIITALIAAGATLGAAKLTDTSPTTVLVQFWDQVTGSNTDATPPRPSLPGNGTASRAPISGRVYHADPLKITYGVADNYSDGVRADLDASIDDPQWGVIRLADSGQYDLTWWSKDRNPDDGITSVDGIDFLNKAQGVVLDSANDSTCQDATGYANHVPYTDLAVGRTLCVVTSDQRYSLLKITEQSVDGNTIAFDGKTFKKDTDK